MKATSPRAQTAVRLVDPCTQARTGGRHTEYRPATPAVLGYYGLKLLYGHPTRATVHHADIINGSSGHGHTSSSDCHLFTLLDCGGGETALCQRVFRHVRRRCDFSSRPTARACRTCPNVGA